MVRLQTLRVYLSVHAALTPYRSHRPPRRPYSPFSRFRAAAARLSAFFSAAVCVAFGSQLPFAPAVVPGTRLNPGQQACPSPDAFFFVAIIPKTPKPASPLRPTKRSPPPSAQDFNAIEIERPLLQCHHPRPSLSA